MSRWIDGDWLLNFFEPYPDDYQTLLGTLRACVDDAPSIDIVRCKECENFIPMTHGCKTEPYIDIETGILHWCGWKYRRIYEDEPQTEGSSDED